MLKQKITLILLLHLLAVASLGIAQGPLTPPGAPSETMKSLTQVYDKATSAVQVATTAVVAANEAAAAATDAEDKRIPLRNPLIVPIGANALITISQPGSYYLAENIKGWANKAGIKITTGSVTLDLNGYSLIGVPTSTYGIHITGWSNHIIRNGTIRNWGSSGLFASSGEGGICENIISASNDGAGIVLGKSYKAIKCISRDNHGTGIFNPAPGALLEACTATSNSASGFSLFNGIAIKCTSNHNTYAGFDLGGWSRVQSCTSNNNRTQGIYLQADKNSVLDCTVVDNSSHGIAVFGDSNQIRGNTCSGNGVAIMDGAGIQVPAGVTRNCIDGNTVQSNDYGIRVQATKNIIIRNISIGNTLSDYSIASGNGNGGFGEVGLATNPWANVFFPMN